MDTEPRERRRQLHKNRNDDRVIAPVGISYADLHCSLKNTMPIDSRPTIELLTIPEVAELLKISIPSVRRLQQARHIPFVKVGGGVRFTVADLATYLQKRRVESIG